MLYCSDTPMDVNVKLLSNQGEPLEELEGHQCLGGIHFLTLTRPNITFVVSMVSQLLNAT